MDEKKLLRLDNVAANKKPVYQFFCPGCRKLHGFEYAFLDQIHSEKDFNYDLALPTINFQVFERDDKDNVVCKSRLKNGKIIFTTDSNHVLAGCEVDLPNLSQP